MKISIKNVGDTPITVTAAGATTVQGAGTEREYDHTEIQVAEHVEAAVADETATVDEAVTVDNPDEGAGDPDAPEGGNE